MIPVTAFVGPNSYGLEPVYYTNVNVGEQVLGLFQIQSKVDFQVLDLYSTENFLRLFWPNRVEVGSSTETAAGKDYSKYMRVE